MTTDLISKSKAYSESLLSKLSDKFAYHNEEHTHQVVEAAEEIGRHSNLSDDELETVIISAWLHDTGYEKGGANHEEISAAKATELLKQWGASEDKIAGVKHAILATRMPQNPKSLVDKVLCDADLYHLAGKDLLDCSNKLRNELAELQNKNFNDKEWIHFNLDFLEKHSYFTEFGRSVLEEKKRKNIKKLKKRLKPEGGDEYVKDMEKELDKLRSKLDKRSNPERGIETMFRIASQNHTTLSGMADTKANIMVSINAIILSVIVSVLFRKLEEFPNLLIPTLMLVSACLLTIVFALLATRPNVTSGKFTREDIKQKKTNLLFFGNFHNMELANYDWGVREMMKDADYLYGSLIKDIYFNGKVLAKKYFFLRISYNIFMYGFVASIIAFIVALLLFYKPR